MSRMFYLRAVLCEKLIGLGLAISPEGYEPSCVWALRLAVEDAIGKQIQDPQSHLDYLRKKLKS